MFLRVNGLFGHIKANDFRSVVSFLGFAVAIQIMAAGVLLIPLMFIDAAHAPLHLGAYLFRYGSAVMLITCGLFIWRYDRYCDDMEEAIGFGMMPIGSQRLRRAVEEMAVTAGIPCPRVAMIESSALNAFACGTKPENSVVVATRGLIDALDDRELRAVVAHEITHIKNGDIRFMASAHVLFGIMDGIGKLNKFKLRSTGFRWRTLFMPALYILPAMASMAAGLAYMIGRATRSGVSLAREFIADAEAVRLSQDAGALVSALRKVEGRSKVDGLHPQFEAMMIDGAARGANPTHPPIAERIAALVRLAGPSAAETYVSGPITPAARGFGRRGAASPFHAAPAFAGMAAGQVTPEEEFVRDYIKNHHSPEAAARNTKLLVVLVPVVFLFFGFISSRMPGTPEDVTKAAPRADAADASPATGCFGRVLQVAADRLYPVSMNPRVIEAYRTHRRDGGDVRFENYIALHRASLLETQISSPDSRDAALIDYVTKRKLHLDSAALFFGADGLRAMQAEYAGSADAALVGEIKGRLQAGARLPVNADVSMADLKTLTATPEKLIPCRAPTRETT